MQRFFISPGIDLSPGATLSLPETLLHQVGRVLRLRPGDRILLLDGSGDESEVELTSFAPGAIGGTVVARRRNRAEPAIRLTLYQCILKGEKMDLVLQKGTELGACAFVPVLSERVVGGDAGTGGAKAVRWRRILAEAAEQSGRGRLPDLHDPMSWRAALSHSTATGATILVPWKKTSLDAAPNMMAPVGDRPLALFIGPEGGLTEAEAEQARAAGGLLLSLGPRILRAETAAIAAMSLLLLPSFQTASVTSGG